MIRKAQECDTEGYLDLFFTDFLPRERVIAACGESTVTEDEKLREETRARLRKWEGVQVLVTVNKSDNAVVGYAFNIYVDKNEVSHRHKPRESVIFDFLQKMEEDQNVFANLTNKCGLELCMLTVQEAHCGKGIARKLVEATVELAKEKKLSFVEAVPTSPATLHLFESLGFQTITEMRLLDYLLDDGKPAFPLASPTDSARYVVKLLEHN